VVRTGRRAHKLRVLRHAAREATLDGHCGAAILAPADKKNGISVLRLAMAIVNRNAEAAARAHRNYKQCYPPILLKQEYIK
jgi:hypothetical protein